MKNSRFVRSIKLSPKNTLKLPPKATLLNKYIEYAADNTIEEAAKTPRTGNLSNAPQSDMNYPTKFNVRGAPQLPKHRIKNKMEHNGIH